MEDKIELMSIQPYFVLDFGGFSQRVLKEKGISHFFSFANSGKSDVAVPLLVDGCSNVIFEYRVGGCRTHFVGSTVRRRTFSAKTGAEYFGVRLQPGFMPAIPGLSRKESVGKVIIMDSLPFARDFCAEMGAKADFDSRIQTFMAGYNEAWRKAKERSGRELLFLQISNLIIQRRGIVKVGELEKLSGYSSRYINLIFESELGLSAKQLCSSVKFQFLLRDMNRGLAGTRGGGTHSLTDLAEEYSFYDQSHFIREFKLFSGSTPSDYLARLWQGNYSANIHNI